MKSSEKNVIIDKGIQRAFIEKGEIYIETVAQVVHNLDYTKSESSLAIAGDAEYHKQCEEKVSHLRGVKYVVLVGIGGSSLSVEAIYAACANSESPQLLILDMIEEDVSGVLETFLGAVKTLKDVAIIVVSKSGITTETIANGAQVLEWCEQKYGSEIHNQIVFIGSEGSTFLTQGNEQGVISISFPESIGGRFSVFTAVGMIPLYILGIDVDAIREGACEAQSGDRSKEGIEHASTFAALAGSGVHTVTFFTFDKELKTLGLWYRQLLAESIGKKTTRSGLPFNRQLLPVVATSVDLHSVAQLYFGGYKGNYTHFVCKANDSNEAELPNNWLIKDVDMLHEKTPAEIKAAIRRGVLKAYDEQGLPYQLTELHILSPRTLGAFMAQQMLEIMVLGELFDLNVFDQPNVEAYKSYTRALLSE